MALIHDTFYCKMVIWLSNKYMRTATVFVLLNNIIAIIEICCEYPLIIFIVIFINLFKGTLDLDQYCYFFCWTELIFCIFNVLRDCFCYEIHVAKRSRRRHNFKTQLFASKVSQQNYWALPFLLLKVHYLLLIRIKSSFITYFPVKGAMQLNFDDLILASPILNFFWRQIFTSS